MILLLLCILPVFILFYRYLTKHYDYWEKRGVPHPKPQLFFGNTKEMTFLKRTIGEGIKDIYDEFHNHPYVGIYELRTPVLLLKDPKLIKLIMIKDFNYFSDRGIIFNENVDPLSAHLINLSGTRWRALRTKLSSTFTTVKIKNVFSSFMEISEKYKKYLKNHADIEDTVEFRDLASKFTTEIIGTCCFGLELNTIQDEDSEFRKMSKKVLDPSLKLQLKRLVRIFMPGTFKRLQMTMNPPDVTKYFMGLVKDIIKYREINHVTRNDFMQLLLELKTTEKSNNVEHETGEKISETGIDDKAIAAQAYVFFLAGLETSATTMSFTLYELAANPDIQQKVYEEIRDVLKKHGSLSYEAILEMEYLDCVVRETLRKHPPVGVTARICYEDYKIPGSHLIIEKGTKIIIPIQAIHYDPKYYENPDTFNPNRFFENHDPCTYLPFGEGPRICIGLRFAYLQTKTGLVAILSDYEVFQSPKTSIPLQYDPRANILTSKSGIWLTIRHRNKFR